MTREDPSHILMQGPEIWNAWREQNPGPVTFSAPRWYDSPGPGGVQIKGRTEYASTGCVCPTSRFTTPLLKGFTFGMPYSMAPTSKRVTSRGRTSAATFRNTKFNKTILTGACFDGATFVNCNLNRINLVGASFRVKEITETVVYGIAAWDLETSDDMKQSKPAIERTSEGMTTCCRPAAAGERLTGGLPVRTGGAAGRG